MPVGLLIERWIRATAHKRRTSYLLFTLTIVAVSMYGIKRLEINDDFIAYFPASSTFRAHAEYATRHLSGPNHIEVEVRTDSAEGVFEPEYVAAIANLSEKLRSATIVSNVFSLSDVLRKVQNALAPESTHVSKEHWAQYFLAYEMSLGYGQSITDMVNKDRSGSRVSVLLSQSDSTSIRELESNIQAWTRPWPYQTVVTGENIPVSHLSGMNIQSMVLGIGASLGLAALFVGLYFRSFEMATSSIAATVAPIAMGFGLWGWFAGEIGLASVVVVAMTLGVIVDDAVHMIYRYQTARIREAMEQKEATNYTMRSVGTAVTSTSVVLAFGFGSLAFSSFGVNKALGLCTSIIVVSALIIDLLVLPEFLSRAKASPKKRDPQKNERCDTNSADRAAK